MFWPHLSLGALRCESSGPLDEDRIVSGLEPTLEHSRPVRRLEIISGIGGRRRWSMDDKARIIEETLAPGAVVRSVGSRCGSAAVPMQRPWRR